MLKPLASVINAFTDSTCRYIKWLHSCF